MRYFAFARTALKFGLIAKGFKASDCVLVPDYVCDAVIQALTEVGLSIIYYPVDDILRPQWEVLDKLVLQKKCLGILMIHYFSQPQDIDRFLLFRDKHSLLLIEDNAHGFGGFFNEKMLGTFGDIGVSSPRKILGMDSGGILYLNGKESAPPFLKVYKSSISKRLIKRLFSSWPLLKVYISVFGGLIKRDRRPIDYLENKVHDLIAGEKASKKIHLISRTHSLKKLAKRQRERWLCMEKVATSIGAKPVFKGVHHESSPWAFPIYIETNEQYELLVKAALAMKIFVFPWPTLPRDVIECHYGAVHRWKRLLCLSLV